MAKQKETKLPDTTEKFNCRVGEPKNLNRVSVIIPTLNSAKTLHFALQSIKEQTYKDIEIIVVDNFSTDNTCEVAKRYDAKVYTIGPERVTQLNYGITKSKGNFIFCTGSDIISDKTYIEEAVKKIKEGYDAVYSSVISKEQTSYWGKVKEFERKMYIGRNEVECARFFRREVYNKLGGFDEQIISMEEDFQHRLDGTGYRTGRINARETHLHEARTLKEVAQKSYYYGTFIRRYLFKHPVRGTKYLCPTRLAFFNIIILKQPHLTVGLIIYKIVQYFYGILGMLTGMKGNIHKEIYAKDSANNPTT